MDEMYAHAIALKEDKKRLENSIKMLCHEYECITGLLISSITINHALAEDRIHYEAGTITDLNVHVEL